MTAERTNGESGRVDPGAHDAVEVILAKRDKAALSDSQIDWVIDAYTRGAVADEQMSALLMAIFLKGMTPAEITRWTAAMVVSEPEPAVVGTAKNGGSFLRTRRVPPICAILWRGLTTRAPAAFAQSITEPPPKATMPLHLLST